MRTMLGYRLEKRLHVNRLWQVLSTIFALGIAFVLSSILIASADANVAEAHLALIDGSFGGWEAFAETLVQSTPLIFTGLAVMVAFRGRLWNIGAEGQFFAGAMATYFVSSLLGGLPQILLGFLILLAAMLAGGIWGGIPGVLKARFGANEVIVTVMMNYIIAFVLSFLLSGPWQDPNSFFLQTARIPESANFTRIAAGTRLHLGFVIGLVVAAILYFLLWRTTIGYEIRAFGANPTAAQHKGINYTATVIFIMVVSGAVAGLAGASEMAGLHHRLRLDISTGYGFTGILVALLGRLHPLGVILAAIVMGILINGSLAMQIATGVPVALAYAIQGIVLVALLTVEVLSRYTIRRYSDV